MKLAIYNLDNQETGSLELSDAVFGLEPRKDILTRMVNWQLAKRRAGTHQVKGRSDVSGTRKKMYKQKGTGRARHSDDKAPQFRGGGRAHGPHVRDHGFDLPRKFRALALRHALSVKARSGKLKIVDQLTAETAKTKAMVVRLENLGATNVLIIGGSELEQNFVLAARNIPYVDVLPSQGTNVYDILRRDVLLLSKDAVANLEERLK